MNPQDPLISTEDMIMKYRGFFDYAIQALQQEQQHEQQQQQQQHGINQEQVQEVKLQRRIEMMEKLNQLARDVKELLRNAYGEMARLQEAAAAADGGSSAARYALRDKVISFVLVRLGNIGSRLEVSTSLVNELRTAKQQITVLMALLLGVREGVIQP